ncbi:Multidrug resistance efflux pump [Ferrimonas sediminum]|uniref:Multidrug resistance efflux pump n=1 Tax=Ferrimonas sediminum TaxID=718193 RepID=A0A1G8SJ38_9GAMM|nr:HlyD family secretion protein [Ferrimonas sediminum]SDJ28650.1 Multidrug resistance efflux pump [Ferrimonas sediminum]
MSNNGSQSSTGHTETTTKVGQQGGAQPAESPTGKPATPSAMTLALLCLCLGLFVFYLVADRVIPSTDMARVRGNVIPITPLVSGAVVDVSVRPNDRVQQGKALVHIDPTDYLIAVKQAEQGLEQAGKQVGIHTASVQAAQVALSDALVNQDNVERQARRIFAMADQGIVTQADADKTRAAVAHANAGVETARSALEQAKKQLGKRGQQNSEIQSALLQLQKAQLDLSRTVIRAPAMGGVSNFRLDEGVYASKGRPLMTFVSGEAVWIEAYFRENSLGNIEADDPVEIALDNAPGRVFRGRVASIDYGVNWQSAQTSGQLATVDNQSGWLRQSQRFPVMMRFDEPLPAGLLRVGGQADVVVYTDGASLMATWGRLWIRLLSWLSYAR